MSKAYKSRKSLAPIAYVVWSGDTATAVRLPPRSSGYSSKIASPLFVSSILTL
ncbi:MAG: hypothetical protein IPK52_12465 [Chloroflexi bacterium]|nr:hypothetical protein [Chloroflexota bacterium]